MGGRTTYLPFIVAAALIFCYATVTLPSTFTDDNPIRVVSDDLQRSDSRTIKAIYQFGDSISDTGNFIREDPRSSFAKLPYGETFFHKPTGRCSDGLLMIDYFAEFFKLPYLDPYLNKDGNFSHGVNFAVAGSTALNVSTLAQNNISYHATNTSLFVQLDWFKSHLHSICSSASEIYKLVPEVVQAIKLAIKEVIKLGAIRIVVPGNFPIGCMTIYLNMFKTNDKSMYDDLQCLKDLNSFAEFHNNKLQEAIKEVREDHLDVTIVYADYVSALQEVLQHATSYGFDKDVMLNACCANCGTKGVPVCEDPYKRVSWDGVHLTQHAYQVMSQWLIKHTSVFNDNSSVKRLKFSFLFLIFSSLSTFISLG
ncbi:GDSL esterase/lipase At5g03980-like isoform X2 [Chenopodium quinoa]|uniref:GDSL esterase/lipase At5g03980-like isoform X2 n=1 Tax=Chenopodium quinoa TaxID=63459 RepID=UPI000B77E87C|nr:GDSL esterase/lipase At5g03980-like isoform X2 [Chenopodium quinoa]